MFLIIMVTFTNNNDLTCFMNQNKKSIDKSCPSILQLLEELSNSKLAAGAKRNLSVQAKKLFDQYGNEIKDVTKLENEQPVWLSFGEPFIEPFSKCVGL